MKTAARQVTMPRKLSFAGFGELGDASVGARCDQLHAAYGRSADRLKLDNLILQ